MKSSTPAAASIAFIAAVLASAAHAAIGEPSGLAAALRPPANESPAFMLAAEGVQIYTCKAKDSDPTAFQWVFVSPEASLRDAGRTVGRHGAGPTWESDSDRSSVKGALVARQEAGAGNIPWLRLGASPSQGDGLFANVTTILRTNTRGGVAPPGGCDATHVGEEARVPYTADYYFYRR